MSRKTQQKVYHNVHEGLYDCIGDSTSVVAITNDENNNDSNMVQPPGGANTNDRKQKYINWKHLKKKRTQEHANNNNYSNSSSTGTKMEVLEIDHGGDTNSDDDDDDDTNHHKNNKKTSCSSRSLFSSKKEILFGRTGENPCLESVATNNSNNHHHSNEIIMNKSSSEDYDEDDDDEENDEEAAFLLKKRDNNAIAADRINNRNGNNGVSNEQLLGTAFFSFASFALVQTIAAFLAGSEAMLGDSAAMMVDCLTYLFNYYAEKWKNAANNDGDDDDDENNDKEDDHCDRNDGNHKQLHEQQLSRKRRIRKNKKQALPHRLKELNRRKFILKLELIPPLISVSTLVVVTIIVTKQSLRLLILDENRPKSEQSEPNVIVMLFFSLTNLLLDFVNVFLFAKAKHLLGYQTVPPTEKTSNNTNDTAYTSLPTTNISEHSEEEEEEEDNAKEKAQDPDEEEIKKTESQYNNNNNTINYNKNRPNQKNKKNASIQANYINNSFAIEHLRPQQSSSSSSSSSSQPPKQSITLKQSNNNHNNHNNHDSSIRTKNKIHDYKDAHQLQNIQGAPSWDDENENENDDDEEGDTNLNMCSAYTHVFADTLRSIAVVIAGGIAVIWKDTISPEVADAVAALIVSFLILCSLIPLFQGMVRSVFEYQDILWEEKQYQYSNLLLKAGRNK